MIEHEPLFSVVPVADPATLRITRQIRIPDRAAGESLPTVSRRVTRRGDLR
jgi:hypothetical protein